MDGTETRIMYGNKEMNSVLTLTYACIPTKTPKNLPSITGSCMERLERLSFLCLTLKPKAAGAARNLR